MDSINQLIVNKEMTYSLYHEVLTNKVLQLTRTNEELQIIKERFLSILNLEHLTSIIQKATNSTVEEFMLNQYNSNKDLLLKKEPVGRAILYMKSSYSNIDNIIKDNVEKIDKINNLFVSSQDFYTIQECFNKSVAMYILKNKSFYLADPKINFKLNNKTTKVIVTNKTGATELRKKAIEYGIESFLKIDNTSSLTQYHIVSYHKNLKFLFLKPYLKHHEYKEIVLPNFIPHSLSEVLSQAMFNHLEPNNYVIQ